MIDREKIKNKVFISGLISSVKEEVKEIAPSLRSTNKYLEKLTGTEFVVIIALLDKINKNLTELNKKLSKSIKK